VKQPPSDDPTRASQGALPRTAGGACVATLDETQGVVRVTATELPLDHDLALSAVPLSFSNPHPRSGETIRIGATVTGRGVLTVPAGAAAVRFFAAEHAGRPPREIGLQRLDAPLGFGDQALVAIDYRAPGRGEVAITAMVELDPAFGEQRREDNSRGGAIGRPASPLHLVVLVPPGAEHPILRWDPPAVDDPPAAYRILRADSADRALEPIAVVNEPRFVDQLASADDRFVYAVEAIDECGVESERSAAASAGPGR
jgi:hypothetical protein